MVCSPYPNVDGACINQESPDLGSVGSKFLRLQPSASDKDGMDIITDTVLYYLFKIVYFFFFFFFIQHNTCTHVSSEVQDVVILETAASSLYKSLSPD